MSSDNENMDFKTLNESEIVLLRYPDGRISIIKDVFDNLQGKIELESIDELFKLLPKNRLVKISWAQKIKQDDEEDKEENKEDEHQRMFRFFFP